MGNYVAGEIRGVLTLCEGVSRKQLKKLFAGHQGEWSLEGGELHYSFWNEGNYSFRGPDHGAMLDCLVDLGYNSTAWREEYSGHSENGGAYAGSELRGTPEQKRQLRIEEVEREIVVLERERQELLVAPT